MKSHIKAILFVLLCISNSNTRDHLLCSLQEIERTQQVSYAIAIFNNLSESMYNTKHFSQIYKDYSDKLLSKPMVKYQLDQLLLQNFEAHMWHEISKWKEWQNIKSQRRHLKKYDCDFKSLFIGVVFFSAAYYLYENTDLDTQSPGRINIEVLKLACIPVLIGLGRMAINNSIHPSESIYNRINALELNYRILLPSTSLESKILSEKFNERLS